MALLFRIGSWTAIGLVAALSLVPAPFRPHLFASGPFEHLAAYATAAAALAATYRAPWHCIAFSIALPVGAGALEVLQHWCPGRDPKFIDFLASAAGTWIGLATAVSFRNIVSAGLTIYASEAWKRSVFPNGTRPGSINAPS